MPNPQRLDILRQLREDADLTQRDMARLCGLRGRQSHQTAGAWERGTVTPAATRRHRFIGYLWDHLRLRQDVEQFEQVWEMLVEEWNWEPIADREWESFTKQPRPEQSAPTEVTRKLEQLEGAIREIQASVSDRAKNDDRGDAGWIAVAPVNSIPQPAPLPPKSRIPFSKNPLFVGRREVLLALAGALHLHRPLPTFEVPTAAITGLGGIGKTQLACEFVHRYGQYFSGGVFWLSFDNPHAIQAEIAACGGSGALALTPDYDALPLDEKVDLVRSAWREPIARLLIFDDCEDPELLHRWRPTSGGCRVLLTSRRGEWEPVLDVQQLALRVLQRGESVELLRNYLPQADEPLLDEISSELGDLPLALHLAGSYLYRYRRVVEPGAYLANIRHPAMLRHASLSGEGISPTDHAQHVGRTFALSYDQLDLSQPGDGLAHMLLVHLACLAPGEHIPQTLLLRSLPPDESPSPTELDDALSRLIELGLVEMVGDAELRMHRLIAMYVQNAAPAPTQAAQTTIEQLACEVLQRVNETGSPLSLLPWQVHLRHVAHTSSMRQDEPSAALCLQLGKHLWLLGDYSGSQNYLETSLAICLSLFGEDHLTTATAHHQLGILRQNQGDLNAAHAHYEQALATRLQLFGEDHVETADVLVDLGDLLWVEKQVDAAIVHLERALTICSRALSEEDLVAAEAANNLAICLLEGKDDPAGAQPYMEKALRIRRQKLGETHPFTALAYNNMGYLLQEMGEFDNAERHYQQALQIRRSSLGDQHPDTAHSLYTTGKLLRVQERPNEAEDNLQQALAIYVDTIGSNQVMTAACQNELGALYLDQQNAERARPLLERALSARRIIYKADHPHIAITLQNLALAEWVQQDLAAAEQHLRQAIQIRQQNLGENHPLTGETLVYLSELQRALGQMDASAALAAQARAIYTTQLDPAQHEVSRLQAWVRQLAGAS